MLGFFADLTHRNFSCLQTSTARKLWRDYFASGVDGVVFIVDAVDRARFPEAKKELDVSSVSYSVRLIPEQRVSQLLTVSFSFIS